MKHATGSPLHFTPEPRNATARFKSTTTNETWTEPLIGWAIVVTWTSPDDDEQETHIEAVVLEDGLPSTTSSYCQSHHDTIHLGVELETTTRRTP